MAIKRALLELRFKSDEANIQRAIKHMVTMGVQLERLKKSRDAQSGQTQRQIREIKQSIAVESKWVAETRKRLDSTDELTAAMKRRIDRSIAWSNITREVTAGQLDFEAKTHALRIAIDLEKASLDATTASLDEQSDSLEEVNRQLTTSQQLRQITTEQRAARSVTTGLSGLRGISRVAGLGGVSQGLGVAGEVASLARELPLLKVALAGMPATVKAAAQNIGAGGVGLIGAIAALAVAFKVLQNAMQQSGEVTRGYLDVQDEVFTLLATGTKEEVQDAIDAAQERIDINRAAQAETSALIESGVAGIREATEPLESVFRGLGPLFATLAESANAGDIQSIRQQFRNLGEEIAGNEILVNRLTNGLASNATAAADAAAAEIALAEARTNATMAFLSDIEQRRQAEQRALNANVETNEQRLDAIIDERNILATQIGVLLATTNRTDELNEELERLQSALAVLNREADFITNTALDAARAIEAETAAREHAEQQREESLSAMRSFNDDVAALDQERLDIEKRFQEAMVEAAEKAAKAAEKALDKLNETRAKLQQKLAESGIDLAEKVRLKNIDAEIKAQRNEAKTLRDHHRKLEKIRLDAQHKEEDLELDRDFRAIFQLRKDTSRRMEAASVDLVAAQQERQIATEQQLADIRTAAIRERAQRLVKFQRDLVDAQAQYQKEIALADQRRVELEARALQEQALQRQANAQQLALRQQALQEELRIISMGLAQRNAFILEGERALLMQVRNFMIQAISGFGGFQPRVRFGSVTATARPTSQGTVRASASKPGAGATPVTVIINEADKPEQVAEIVHREINAVFGD